MHASSSLVVVIANEESVPRVGRLHIQRGIMNLAEPYGVDGIKCKGSGKKERRSSGREGERGREGMEKRERESIIATSSRQLLGVF